LKDYKYSQYLRGEGSTCHLLVCSSIGAQDKDSAFQVFNTKGFETLYSTLFSMKFPRSLVGNVEFSRRNNALATPLKIKNSSIFVKNVSYENVSSLLALCLH
jgi:hypothetical protein